MKDIIKECKEVLTEYGFVQRWDEIEKWHQIGEILNEAINLTETGVKNIADVLELGESELWDAIYFYKRYPNLDLFPCGKNISWRDIKENLE